MIQYEDTKPFTIRGRNVPSIYSRKILSLEMSFLRVDAEEFKDKRKALAI